MQAQPPDPLNQTPSAPPSSFSMPSLPPNPLQNQTTSQIQPQLHQNLPVMSQPTPQLSLAFTMPAQGHHSALKFDGLSEELSRFCSDLKRHALCASLSNQEKIEYALQYVSVKISCLWGRLPESNGADWDMFKEVVFTLYPETIEE
jgi:hypothetical protein